ncbi:MAG TPA: aspartyl/asparaginyl beta-hydroxylase domain-containing protein [Gammaproteobacteria bacterium]|nr:aspartyl/asparaginyl beta-hydroxylase domain-containing protein [Gammaproteobacteria bacterium]
MSRPPTNPAPDQAWQVRTFVESAAELEARGELDEAENVYHNILAVAPYHLHALNFLAVRALERDELDESEGYLDRALRAAPERAATHQNLALLHRARGKLPDALQELDRALALNAELRSAWLIKGVVLDQLDRRDEAVMALWRGWRQFPTAQQLTETGIAPPHLHKLVRDAAHTLRTSQRALMQEGLRPVEEQHGRASLAGVWAACEIYLGERPPDYLHPLQRPHFLYLPGIPARAFFERGALPWSGELEAATAAICAELEAVLESGDGTEPYVQSNKGIDPERWRELDHSRRWSAFHLLKAGARVGRNCARCPTTWSVLESLPLPCLSGHAPEALFSILEPGTHIPPHHGLGNYKLVVHLPLVIPEDCSIRVGEEARSWRKGECLVFDDSFEHEAWNRSSARRSVLILDAWNPLLSEAERDGMTALVEAIAVFNEKYCNPA